MVLPSVIDQMQGTFLGGRNLVHRALIANEVVDEAKQKNRNCMIFKVDFEKAYDSVNWEFLLYMLHRLSFCDKWRLWIKECLKSSKVSVLVNGSPTNEFYTQKGLR
uniref:Reverse transcriptase domain-containing protein n=1 Tax=Cajanus cajan TaxID=3821 RepID=A0A151QUM9_CAJCA|nr:hypothetical protein KK1_045098 [Cajanus cajan]